MKVLFLDIDGVLNSRRSCIAFGNYPHDAVEHRERFDEVAVRLIRGIVKAAGASIVLSSSWRKDRDWERIGPALELPIIDRTPTTWEPDQLRGHEIAQWLAAHPEVECYAIVDDDSDMLEEQKPYFVHTTHQDGFQWEHAERLAELLGIAIYDVNHPRASVANEPV